MDSIRSQLECLTEDAQGNVNYESWRFKLDLTLKTKKIFDVATGIVVKPEGTEDSQNVSAWLTKDLEAQALIGLNCSSLIAMKISRCTSAYSMLSKLDTLYGKKSDVSIEGLQRQFFGYKYNESKSVIENCMQIQQLADSLEAEGEQMKETWIMQRILGILPPKLHHFRTVWDNVSGVEKSLSNLFDRLRLEEDRLNESQLASKSTSQNAFISKHRSKSDKSTGSQKSKSLECFKCGKTGHMKSQCQEKPSAKYLEYCKNTYGCNKCKCKGHFAKDCPNVDFSQQEDRSNKYSKNGNNRRALITVSLSVIDFFNTNSQDCWYQDCAATQHMSSHKEWFKNYTTLEQPSMIVIGDATELEGIGIGDIELEAFDGQTWQKIVLQNVLHTPKMPFNLFSVSSVLDKGYRQSANADKSIFKDENGNVGAIAVREGKLYKMKFRQESEKCLMNISLRKWHEKLAHQNVTHVRNVLIRSGVKFQDDWDEYVCPGCTYGKQHRVSHPLNPKTSEKQLDLIHVDLCEMNIHSLGGAKYFLLFKDDYSHFRTVYFLKHKNETAAKLETFLRLVENQFDRKVKTLRSDNGTEIKNRNTQQILERLGVFHSKSSAYTPQQNGRIEREMRTIVEAARTVIHARGLNENLWGEAVNYAVFTINHTGTSSVKGKSPVDLWFGRKIDINKLKSFGCDCYVLKEDNKRGKTEKKSTKGLFVGYDTDSAGFRVFINEVKDVVSSSNVVFDDKIETESFAEIEMLPAETSVERSDTGSEYESLQADETEVEESPPVSPVRRNLRNRRVLRPPSKFKDYVTDTALILHDFEESIPGETSDIPVSEALKDENWKKAMSEEFDSLTKMKTWILTEKPIDITPLTCRWVLRKKDDGKYKARLVVRGFEQKEGKDYFEVFSPVARLMSIRLILSIAASEGMKIMTFDVKTAFLHGKLDERIFMYQPEGFNDKSGRICELKKSLYGLKQAPKIWNATFSNFLKSLHFRSTDDDPCVHYNKKRSVIIVLHVDDGLMVGQHKSEMLEVLKKLDQKFKITIDTEKNNSFLYLGMQVQVSENKIFVNQSKYAERIVQRYKFEGLNPAHTPIERGMVTDPENFVNDSPLDKSKPYREAVGSLLYLATISRPDICFTVNYLSRFNNKPMNSHWKMIRRVFQYVKRTIKFGICFNGSKNLSVYSDSDYGGDTETGHSTSGVLLLRGGPIVWFTQKQSTVSNSTAEAEYRAAVSAIDEVCWIRRLAKELKQLDTSQPTSHYIDNQSAIHMLNNTHEGKITKGKKHIEISRKFIQQHIGSTVTPVHVRSKDQLADILTKPLVRKHFEYLRSRIIKEECW